MGSLELSFAFFLVFGGAAIIASLSLFARQPLIMAYVLTGLVAGPHVLNMVPQVAALEDISHIGIAFLLFLLGLDMQPQSLFSAFTRTGFVVLLSSLVFAAAGAAVGFLFGFPAQESVLIGLMSMFSSTIIGIKLLPITVLHHRRSGELMVGLLLWQDLLAILVLLALPVGSLRLADLGALIGGLPLLIGFAWLCVRFLLLPLLRRFDKFHEYIFLLAIGWCLGMSEGAAFLGLPFEVGALVAGVSLAYNPISQYIAINLKPLRDFFLVLFFFLLGARFNLSVLGEILLPALALAVLMLGLKPLVFRLLLGRLCETPPLAWDLSIRLGQGSEFSLLIAYLALELGRIGESTMYLVQAATILSLLASSYIVICFYPTPLALVARLRRD